MGEIVQDILIIIDKLKKSADIVLRCMAHVAEREVVGGQTAHFRGSVGHMVEHASTGRGCADSDAAMVDELQLLVYHDGERDPDSWGARRRECWRAEVDREEMSELYAILCTLEVWENTITIQGGGTCLKDTL